MMIIIIMIIIVIIIIIIIIITTTTIFFIVSFFYFFSCQPGGVEENEICKILWDMTIQCDHIIEATRPDIVVVEKESNNASQLLWILLRHGITEFMKRRVQRLRNAKI